MRHEPKELTIEEFDRYCEAGNRIDAVAEAADEVGGPRLSLVPVEEREIAWPTDLLPPALPDADAPTYLGSAGGGTQSLQTMCHGGVTWQQLEELERAGAQGLMVLSVERSLA